MKKYIKSKLEELIKAGKEPEYESLSVIDFVTEFDYATKYLSRLLKVRPFVMYLLLFKRAYFEEGKRVISVKLSELGENLLSDLGQAMSHDVVKRGVNDLIRLKIVEKRPSKPGQINEYEVRLPSEIREVQEMIKREEEKIEEIIDDSKDDFYTDPQKRVEILKREDYKCFYCLHELQRDDFYLDHLAPLAQGGQNYKSNLVASCRTCNTRKTALEPENFLLQNYRKGLLTQEEYSTQKDKLKKLREEYRRVELGVISHNTA
ncbi:MAG: HNH endonuclease signature motif containing protein [Chloroflexota bacterium]|nr:HNH endonuclease signature motif containing protein [Chloroflexota bacterium]